MWSWLAKIDPNVALALVTAIAGVFAGKRVLDASALDNAVRAAVTEAWAWVVPAFPVGTTDALKNEARLRVVEYLAARGHKLTPRARGIAEAMLSAFAASVHAQRGGTL